LLLLQLKLSFEILKTAIECLRVGISRAFNHAEESEKTVIQSFEKSCSILLTILAGFLGNMAEYFIRIRIQFLQEVLELFLDLVYQILARMEKIEKIKKIERIERIERELSMYGEREIRSGVQLIETTFGGKLEL